jgi:hypothetical protein
MIPQNDDYKIYVFRGKPGFIDVTKDRFKGTLKAFYTPSWRKIDMKKHILPTANIEKPRLLQEMLLIAKQLSRDLIHFVRVDIFVSEQNIVFSELTMSPSACILTFTPSIADRFYGLLAAGSNQDPESIISILQERHSN